MPRLAFQPLDLAACAIVLLTTTACVRVRPSVASVPAVDGEATPTGAAARSAFCGRCTTAPDSEEVRRAVAARVADLKARGGACEVYGTVLEGSLAGKRLVVRPFMWRIGLNLASAQALSSGEIDVAREIDPLNVGVRSLDDVVHSAEHEAAHIAFAIPSGQEWTEALVNERVEECRVRSARTGAASARHEGRR